MAGLILNLGETYFLKTALGSMSVETLNLRLYTNDYQPVDASITTNFTESVGSGYASIVLNPASWVHAVSSTATTATYPQTTFTFSAAASPIYGYFVTTGTSNQTIIAEKFPTAYTVTEPGTTVKISILLTLSDTAS